ncbi:MAG: substrate-binding domain-containing protein [Planctomycetaceae bacterium]|nr:substrate-binding domain-containing protein [Planctomycetaceae bacterium]
MPLNLRRFVVGRWVGIGLLGAALGGSLACDRDHSALSQPEMRTHDNGATAAKVRCAVIGGMTDTGLWQGIAERFTQATGIEVELVATGPKHLIAEPFRRGEADLITMHSSDTIINLVADGLGENPQPWLRNDLLWVGPKADPAQIRGMTDGVAALAKIIQSKSQLLVHQSLGTNEVLHDLLWAGELELDLEHTVTLPSDRHRQLLERAAAENAYAIVGRIPFLNGKIADGGLELMVQGDPRMRRPYLAIVAAADRIPAPQHRAATKLAEFLRAPETQQWIADFGRGALDQQPIFFPVTVPGGSMTSATSP